MPYATANDLTSYFDANVIADLVSDDGVPAQDVTTDPNVAKSLSAAASQINAAVMVSNLYSPADLASLTGDDREMLLELNCQLAMSKLIRRRPEKFGADGYRELVEEGEERLEQLRKGQRLFNLPAQEEAGLPEVDGPTVATVEQLNLITARTKNFYPDFGRRLPLGR